MFFVINFELFLNLFIIVLGVRDFGFGGWGFRNWGLGVGGGGCLVEVRFSLMEVVLMVVMGGDARVVFGGG